MSKVPRLAASNIASWLSGRCVALNHDHFSSEMVSPKVIDRKARISASIIETKELIVIRVVRM